MKVILIKSGLKYFKYVCLSQQEDCFTEESFGVYGCLELVRWVYLFGWREWTSQNLKDDRIQTW